MDATLGPVEEALTLAIIAHRGQTDFLGEPYIFHPIRVLMAVRARGGDIAAQCAAVLHDTIEDTFVTTKMLYDAYGPEVSNLVFALSRRPAYTAQWTPDLIGVPEEPYNEFIQRVIAAGRVAMIIKECDIDDNMSRMEGVRATDPAKAARLEAKYIAAKAAIFAARRS